MVKCCQLLVIEGPEDWHWDEHNKDAHQAAEVVHELGLISGNLLVYFRISILES
jgi:hypothetical protein